MIVMELIINHLILFWMRNFAKLSVFCQNIESNQYFLVFLKKCMVFAVLDIDLDMSLPVLCTVFVNCP